MSQAGITGVPHLSKFLRMAVMAGVESAVRIHVERGDDLNARDSDGLTPLMLAAARNRPAICRLLLDAGADDTLLDTSGRTALAVALAAGSQEAAAILRSAIAPPDEAEQPVPGVPPCSESATAPSRVQATESPTALTGTDGTEGDRALPDAQAGAVQTQQPHDTPEFDLSGWEAEEDRPPPEADLSIAEAATVIQSAITDYEPVDSSAEWEDIDAYLPERSLPLTLADDAEARERLRLLLLRAVREGSVPSADIEALSFNEDRSLNPETESLLGMVINDLGAEADERFEYASVHENFKVFVKPETTPDEEQIVADSLAFIDSLASRGNDPLRIYQKELQRERLISAQDEVLLGQAMERGLEKALDALAAWPRGVTLTLAAGHLVRTGRRPLSWFSLGPATSHSDSGFVADDDSDPVAVADVTDEQAEPGDETEFGTVQPLGGQDSAILETLDRLASLPTGSAQQGADWSSVRAALSSLRLSRRFLLELTDVADERDLPPAAEYVSAIMSHERARERMATANLKLVFHLAKKYLYSGEPLDDLAQEGNIGLLKAVERYDWRRGFKFSTYATWWIRQHIGRYIADKCRTIRIPVHLHEKVQRLLREVKAFESETGRAPEPDEIAARLDMPVHQAAALQRIADEPVPVHELDIDKMIAVEARSGFVSPDPMDRVFESQLAREIDKLLSTLKPKEARVLRLRYGIGINDALTLEETGCLYEVTRERIRQIEAAAFRKLNQPSRKDALAHAAFGSPRPELLKEENCLVDPEPVRQALESRPMQLRPPVKKASGSLPPFSAAKSSGLERLLSQAAELGILVDDGRTGTSGHIWINITEPVDTPSRRLIRKMTSLGFEFWPGKGYWK